MATTADTLAVAALDVIPRLGRLVARVLESDAPQQMTLRQFRILVRLDGDADAIGALATGAGVNLPSMSQTVHSLAGRGWVVREEDPADRRRRVVRLTADGRDALAGAQAALISALTGVLDGLSRAERGALEQGLGAVGRELDRRWERLLETHGG